MLDNGLKVVLCSDPTSNEVGAAMDVHVGACYDPKEAPGLAHFNEHMLFLGTKEYPKEDSFEGFLSANGGTSMRRAHAMRNQKNSLGVQGLQSHFFHYGGHAPPP